MPTPLYPLQKDELIDEDPLLLDENCKEIKFNDLLIVLNYHPDKEVT